MTLQFLTHVFQTFRSDDAIVYQNKTYPYNWLIESMNQHKTLLTSNGINSGSVVMLESNFSPPTISLLLALIDHNCIIAPFSGTTESNREKCLSIISCQYLINFDDQGQIIISQLDDIKDHLLYQNLRKCKHPGLILFSSGSTGEPKAALHDFSLLLKKYTTRRSRFRTAAFLLFDHIGGINTMFYTLSNGGCLIIIDDRNPKTIMQMIQTHRIELLPTTPTFLNLLILSEVYKHYDLRSLKLITYGTEPMPKSTLTKINSLLPNVRLRQTYGLSEVGILQSKSRDSNSLWMKIGGKGYETRIVDGILHIRADSAMVGYLNAPSPFTKDGWMVTDDMVEQQGDYIKIIGRQSDIINVGGQKVYPAEVENIILKYPGIKEALVYGEKQPLLGHIVCAKISTLADEVEQNFLPRLKRFCRKELDDYKVPIKIILDQSNQFTTRHKKDRRNTL